jgi:hypothetical protein
MKEEKLMKLRRQASKRQEKKEKKSKEATTGKDFYLRKVTNFLVTSFFLNLAIEFVYPISMLHDYINGYLKNNTYMFYGLIEGNNYCFLIFYTFRFVGYILTVLFFIDSIQKDVRTADGRKRLAAR